MPSIMLSIISIILGIISIRLGIIVIASRVPPRHSEALRLRGFEALQDVERVLEEYENDERWK